MTTLYSNVEGKIYVKGSTANLTSKFPVGTYTIKQDSMGQFFLSPVEQPPVPKKLYGDHRKKVDRIINTWKDRNKDTGVLLSGLKGSGKTLIIKMLATELASEGVSTIYINDDFHSEEFITFINSIEGRNIIVFDEYEKVFGYNSSILTLLDGLYAGNRLYLFSVNEMNVSSFLLNRPGRIFYHWKFESLTDEEITEFCEDRLKDMSKIDEILRAAKIITGFNFDILSAIVEESNRYGETISEIISVLNVDVETDETSYYKVLEFKYKNATDEENREIDEVWLKDRRLNIFKSFDMKIQTVNKSGTVTDDNWYEYSDKDIVKIDKDGLIYFDDEEHYFVLKKVPPTSFQYFG